MAILWQFLSHRGSLMAPRHLQLEYPLAAMIWSALEHFRVSGSTPTGQLLCSFTEAIRVASVDLCHFSCVLAKLSPPSSLALFHLACADKLKLLLYLADVPQKFKFHLEAAISKSVIFCITLYLNPILWLKIVAKAEYCVKLNKECMGQPKINFI